MKLEMGYIHIRDVRLSSFSKIEDGILYVSEEDLKKAALQDDDRLASVSFDVAKPGESVRITPVSYTHLDVYKRQLHT